MSSAEPFKVIHLVFCCISVMIRIAILRVDRKQAPTLDYVFQKKRPGFHSTNQRRSIAHHVQVRHSL